MIKTVDAKGLSCPQPLIRAKDALKEMKEGVLEVLVSDEIAVQNLLKYGKYSQLITSSEKIGEKEYRVTFEVGERAFAAEASDAKETGCPADQRQKGSVVVISADHMGEGDEELGRILMKGYIYALTQLDTLPERILLYNGGARLSAAGAETLEDLKTLEAEGVEILTCGTCLNYYGISDQLAVGGVTNMYEIAQIMMTAGLVVRP